MTNRKISNTPHMNDKPEKEEKVYKKKKFTTCIYVHYKTKVAY